jgi:hypothetical protein
VTYYIIYKIYWGIKNCILEMFTLEHMGYDVVLRYKYILYILFDLHVGAGCNNIIEKHTCDVC